MEGQWCSDDGYPSDGLERCARVVAVDDNKQEARCHHSHVALDGCKGDLQERVAIVKC